mmetsp:Transcript_9287/g.13992  ORF Transcript_9287/g.13992 Transcript_9287/m.13992 type:complete len:242 (-) Transcript_9287:143-868(-)
MESLYQLMKCLDFPQLEGFNVHNQLHVIALVCWLEDRKIRELEIEEREPLRCNTDSWSHAMQKYLDTLGSPCEWDQTNPLPSLEWLLSYAISLEYDDIAQDCADMEPDCEDISTDDTNSILTQHISELGEMVGLSRQSAEGNADFLQRISRHSRFLLTPGSLEAILDCDKETHGGNGNELEDFPLGFDTGDAVVNKLAVVLKMLHLTDFRELQSDINSLIVLGQQYTADPKTNSTLGKVGK